MNWLVLADPIELSSEQIGAFTSIINGNNRPTQPRGARVVQIDRAGEE